MNESGNSNNLEPQHFGNTSAVRHGAFSRRTLAPRASEIADELLEAGHTVGLDRLAAEEIGSLVAMAEAMDDDLLSRGLTDRHGKARSLVELRIRISGRLQRWLQEFGATPASRVQWVERLSRGENLAEVVKEEVAHGRGLLEDARARGDLESSKSEEPS